MATESESVRRESALAYLREQLGARAPAEIQLIASFHETPLAGEGPISLFSFEMEAGAPATGSAADGAAQSCGRRMQRFFVFAGETTPNYFPAYEFDADDAYSFHMGTRFALEVGVSTLGLEAEPASARPEMEQFVKSHLPHVRLTDAAPAGVFAVGDQTFVVFRLTLNGEQVYFLGGDAPPGFYRLAHLPPQVALRLHLGKLIREEARDEQRSRAQP